MARRTRRSSFPAISSRSRSTSPSPTAWSSATLVVAKGAWDKIAAADQQMVQKAAYTWRDKQRKMVQEWNKVSLAKLKAEDADQHPRRRPLQAGGRARLEAVRGHLGKDSST